MFIPKCHVFSKYQSFRNASLRIYIRWQSFNPTSFASKVFEFSKCLSLKIYKWRRSFNPIQLSRFIFDNDHLISFSVYIRGRSFIPTFQKLLLFQNCIFFTFSMSQNLPSLSCIVSHIYLAFLLVFIVFRVFS